MNKLKNYISAYLFSFIGYCMCIGEPIIFKTIYEQNIFSTIWTTCIFTIMIAAYPIAGIIICFIIEWLIKKIFKYKSNIKNDNNIMDFIFKLGIFFGLLPFVILIASAICCFTPLLVIPEKILMFIDEHICDFFCFLKIIITLGNFYSIYLLWKFIFKKDKN